MTVGAVGPLSLLTSVAPQSASQQSTSTGNGSFGQFLSNAINDANSLSNQADVLSSSYAAGGPTTLDQVMIAEQKASLALDLVVQVRDRVVNAYQTVMNMQV